MCGTVVRVGILAQASSSRLGQISRNSPWFCSSISLKRPILVLSDALSHSGENGSPKRVLKETRCALCSRPRPGEGLWFWASGGLTQARARRALLLQDSLRRQRLA
ncbi:hypothetical protein DEO72_LG5g1034 [Vigna unguiculata]|uniref:Uncharacterized protein n=1 Tax=Vigna unguiculata TaxID=3917 RepID=A0A4D6LWB9_VIGUN|nr:hypothetical protein DEO72_LG5g1034 [Vigna unguiculata]